MDQSLLGADENFGDALIGGASPTSQLEENLADLEKGPLPNDIVQVLDNGRAVISGTYQY